MDETLERDATAEPVLAECNEEAAPDAVEPKAYAFDGWGLIPLDF